MKDWIQRWLGMGKPLPRDVDELARAKDAHIADLRILIDKGHEREEQLGRMVEMAMQHQFYRPTITGKPSEKRSVSAISPDSLTDVAVFDEKADQEQSEKQEAALQELIREQNEKGVHKVA